MSVPVYKRASNVPSRGGATVADIFISYSSLHRDLTRALAAAIEAEHGAGSVWWDEAGLRGGDKFSPEITRALDAAKAVVVVWTQGAVTSDWVYAEAVRAASQRKVGDLDVTQVASAGDHVRLMAIVAQTRLPEAQLAFEEAHGLVVQKIVHPAPVEFGVTPDEPPLMDAATPALAIGQQVSPPRR
jgi:TIR domain